MLASTTLTFPQQSEVKLLMESRGFARGARSTFSKTWSKLFQVGPYFVDLSCTPEGNKAKFAGQIMLAQNGADSCDLGDMQISLTKGSTSLAAALDTQLDPQGSFNVMVEEPGVHALELNSGSKHFLIDGLALV